MKKNLFKIFAACFALFIVFSSSAFACTPVLVMIRHAEDQDNPNGTSSLDKYGEAHSKAYVPLFTGIKNKLDELIGVDVCPFTKITSLYTPNPKATVKSTAAAANISVKDEPNFVLPILDKDASTLLVLNRQTIWGKESNIPEPVSNSFLGKIAGSNATIKQMIKHAGSPRFNYLYVFKNQNADGTFNDASIYIQMYNTDKKKFVCVGRLKKDDFTNHEAPIVDIVALEKFPDSATSFDHITKQYNCYWPDK